MHLDSKTEQAAAIMPCYGIDYDPNDPDGLGEHVGSAYSKHNISILRNAGWDGMLCTDWMILEHIAWGVKDLSVAERYAKLMNNTISQHGGSFQPDVAKEAYDLMVKESGEDQALATLRDNARRIFAAMMKVQLFEQPYSDRNVAKAVFENEKAAAFGVDASDKCVIMLKNSDGVIAKDGMADKPKVYIPQVFTPEKKGFFGPSTPASVDLCWGGGFADNYFDVVTDRVADSAEVTESDITRLTADQDYVRKESLNPVDELGNKENRSVFGQSTYCTNESELDFVLDIKSKLPADAKLILIVDINRPMVFSEIEPSADAILVGFNGIMNEAFAHVITGQVEPSGLLPYQMPKDMKTVFEQNEDVPRDMDCYVDADGNTYDFCFGLNWSGVIDDERTKTYKAAPLTKPETEVVATD